MGSKTCVPLVEQMGTFFRAPLRNHGGQMGHCIESIGHILRNFLRSKIDVDAYGWHCR